MTSSTLLIPGPVQTDPRVKAAMAQDIAPWDSDVRSRYSALRERLRVIAGGTEAEHVCLPLQGCGHFVVEACLRTLVPAGGKVLIPSNGNYGSRMARLAHEAGRVPVVIANPEGKPIDAHAVANALENDKHIRTVSLVYSETATAIINPIERIAEMVRAHGRRMIVDAISGFGALPFDLSSHPETDAIVFTSNKCLEAMPGVGIVIARIDRLKECSGNARSWSLDLSDIYQHGLTFGWGSIRFTPTIQALAALEVALDIFDEEGGQDKRLQRYTENARILWKGLIGLGLSPWLPWHLQGPIIVNMMQPTDPRWDLQRFVDMLKRRGFIISNFSTTSVPTLRIGAIGRVFPEDMHRAVEAVDSTLLEMRVEQRSVA